ncbi:response regulator [Blastomonas sp.]|uniref:response regulator n=1 Tax=Blastomonas sp. TaxID=1909299 RepID=UPI002630BD0C|nr:response regulator [Blastomonas sp.]MDM7957944.1 response regulator [Blastomonas sp.]
MSNTETYPLKTACVSLVDGDAAIRHARQLLLRSMNYDVRSYATSAALLADQRSRECRCVVLDTQLTGNGDELALLHELRITGWTGHAILLDGAGLDPEYVHAVERHGDRIMARTVGDETLLAAIAASINHN